MEGGAETMPLNWLTPVRIAANVTRRMPIRIAPGTLSASREAMTKKPSTLRSTPVEVRSPSDT